MVQHRVNTHNGTFSTGYRNPFLADSENPIAHGRCDQQDNTAISGPRPTGGKRLTKDELVHTWIGPGHFGGLISSPYPDGKRVIWSNGREQIVKLDYDTLEILATYDVSEVTNRTQLEEDLAGLDDLTGDAAIGHAANMAMRYLTGLDGIYSLLDAEGTLFLGRKEEVVAYSDAVSGDRTSGIVEKARWGKPANIDGYFVGINITHDGRLVLSTDHGWIVCLERDFSDYTTLLLPEAENEAAEHCARMQEERGNTGYGWVRTSMCADDSGGIYTSSVDHLHRVVWTGERLSLDEADGAWVAEYRNGTGRGSGTTPCLMGFGDEEDRFVVIGDGDDVVNITLFWRDQIPEDWEGLPDAPSRRIAGLGPANMGNPNLKEIQTEQSITVSGYGAMTVNNHPASTPEYLPERGARMLCFFLGHDPTYTPFGMHKFEWDPTTRSFNEAWVALDVSSPNSVPFVSQGEDLVYTCGVREENWSIEAIDWSTGQSVGYWIMGDSQFNTLGAGITIDDDGRIMCGSIFGKTRLIV